MPHLRIEYTVNLEARAAIGLLCQALTSAMAALADAGQPMFPLHGTRVLAYPAPFHSVANGGSGNGFVYLNLRIAPGRPAEMVRMAGEALLAVVRVHFDRAALGAPVGITLHIDEVRASYEGRVRAA